MQTPSRPSAPSAESSGQGSATVQTLVNSSRVIVMLGAGGVGKTTMAIVMALVGASQGRRVALLSIDPAKRLAAALGITLGSQLQRLVLPPEAGIAGTVDAAMLDQKAVFDAMVQRHAPSPATAAKILAHPVYEAASTNLAGPLEYMALAKLQELAEDSRYDLLILDTPPDTQALDFLARPNVLAGFMENRVMNWLIKPFLTASRFGLGKLFSVSERLMGGIAKVTGISALRSFGEFMVLMQEVIGGFNQSGERTAELLHRADTRFMLVAAPTSAAVRSAQAIVGELSAMGYAPQAVLFNKCLPASVVADLQTAEVTGTAPDVGRLQLQRRLAGETKLRASLLQACSVANLTPLVLSLADEEHTIGNLEAILKLVARLQTA